MRRQIEAFNRGDLEGFIREYDDKANIYDYPDNLMHHGAGNLKEIYRSYFASAPRARVRVLDRIVQGNFVIDKIHVTGVPQLGIPGVVNIFEVRDGKIVNEWVLDGREQAAANQLSRCTGRPAQLTGSRP